MEVIFHFGHNVEDANLRVSGMGENSMLFYEFKMYKYPKKGKEHARDGVEISNCMGLFGIKEEL